ncbi:MAG: hypothetical protein NZL92_09935 [Gloeomargarita sp. SKYG116]|nr:hypothetical protein [Gloeomargarita sp. SKYG116]MCS7225663.1 hypothetical protein [Gloeomargarita sp. SKYB31]MDW8402001.1 hypothetical protein [Gloeomargarita sp. SKYGB_i_bin116]
MPDWWQKLNGLLVEAILDWDEHAQAWANLWEEWDSQLEAALWEWEAPVTETATWLEETLLSLVQPLTRSLDPLLMDQPACVGCKHYHGQVYNGQILVCAMHPYGVEGNRCPDWEGFWT